MDCQGIWRAEEWDVSVPSAVHPWPHVDGVIEAVMSSLPIPFRVDNGHGSPSPSRPLESRLSCLPFILVVHDYDACPGHRSAPSGTSSRNKPSIHAPR